MIATLVAIFAAVLPSIAQPALADDHVVCRVTFALMTGRDGIRDDSMLTVNLGDEGYSTIDVGNTFVFEDSDGDGAPDPSGGRPFHSGGTGDRANAEFSWDAHLDRCAPQAALRAGFVFRSVTKGDDWDLQGLRITDRDTGQVYVDRSAETGPVHRFRSDVDQWNTDQRDTDEVCRVVVSVTTGKDGLRDDSKEAVTLGGQDVIFEDWDGDGNPDPYDYVDTDRDGRTDLAGGVRFHKGGTGDTANKTFIWNARLAPCLPYPQLRQGLTITHSNDAWDAGTDNWDLKGLIITDRDTGEKYVDLPDAVPYLHRFQKNSDQTWSTRVYWNTPPTDPILDTDHDGLSDLVELQGIRHDDGTLDTYLPDHGADPCRRTIAVETDWLEDGAGSDRPSPAALNEAQFMFADAPVDAPADCPYGWRPSGGIQLLTDASEGIRVTAQERKLPLDKSPVDGEGQTRFDRYRAAHFTRGREGLFFYSLWGYTHDGGTSSGVCCRGPKQNDFMVTLGSWANHSVRAEAGTFSHELGHALDLRHGGGDDANFKPNYLSIMSYRYQTIGIPDMSAWRTTLGRMPEGVDFDLDEKRQILESVSHLDFSRSELRTLDQSRLVEAAGVGADEDLAVAWWDPETTLRVGDARQGLDWDWSDSGRPDEGAATKSVDLMSGFQVCVRPQDQAGEEPKALVTKPKGNDILRSNQILAGSGGICDTPAEAPDALVAALNFDYPLEYGYKDGIRGFDDWAHLRFRVGVSPDAQLPLHTENDHGITERDRDQAVSELFDTLTGVGTSAPLPQPRWGYAYVNTATESEAPLGVETSVHPGWQWTTAMRDPVTADRKVTVTHTGTGEYEVRFPYLASVMGTAHVTPYRTVYRGRTCTVAGYEPSRADELVKVHCFDQTGAPIDWWFTVLFTAPSTNSSTYATVRYDVPGGTAGIDPVVNSGTYNSEARVNRVHHEGTGRYRVVLSGVSFARARGQVQVSSYGGGTPARCQPEGTKVVADTLEVSVTCYALGTTTPPRTADAQWLMTYTDGVGLHTDRSVPTAYTGTTGDPASPRIDTEHSFSSGGESPSVNRLGKGWYRLSWNSIGKYGGNVHVSATGADGGYCHLGAINDYTAPPHLSVDVYCHDPSGKPGDTTFAVAYVRRP